MSDVAKDYSLDVKIGQMLMFGFKGSHFDDESVKLLHEQISQYHLGALLFVGYNIKDPLQTKLLTKYLKSAQIDFPLLIAIDQEGGQVQRLNSKKGFDDFPSALEISEKFTLEESKNLYNKMLYTCKNYGFNFILAPCVDLNINPASPVIGAIHRSYSENPEIVGKFANAFLETALENKLISCLKHYPGHGSANEDSHKGFTDVSETWQDVELMPYKTLIETENVQTIMSAHIYNKHIDEEFPASLSKKHLDINLRQTMSYNQVIITDDLQMGAIHQHYSLQETVIQAILAGNDILMFSQFFYNETDLPLKVIEIIKNAIKTNILTETRINQSFNRIVALKEKLK